MRERPFAPSSDISTLITPDEITELDPRSDRRWTGEGGAFGCLISACHVRGRSRCYWPSFLARVYDRRQLRQLERIGAELGSYIGERDREAAEREVRLLRLSAGLIWLTAAVLVTAIATIIVTLVA
jgi:hypothetical protein